jgi:hypothetical protein
VWSQGKDFVVGCIVGHSETIPAPLATPPLLQAVADLVGLFESTKLKAIALSCGFSAGLAKKGRAPHFVTPSPWFKNGTSPRPESKRKLVG